jgi:hypothetical protein
MSQLPRRYCLDANVLIQAWQKYYAYDICPDYWAILKGLGHSQTIFICQDVAEEITRTEDELAKWLKASGMPVYPREPSVLSCLSNIFNANPVHRRLVDNIKGRSLADPWVIAHAMDQKACVVTKENKETKPTDRIKIPNVCENMGISWMDDFQLIKELGLRFSCTVPEGPKTR